MSVLTNLVKIHENIAGSAARVNRNQSDITLIAVTKYSTAEAVNEALSAGVTDIGENRVMDGIKKFPLLQVPVTKHLIGSLQTNKVKPALHNYDLIHSVDRVELLEELAKQALKLNKPIPYLFQLNISGETSKHGLIPDDLTGLLKMALNYELIIPSGLMTIPPLSDNPEDSRPIYRELRNIFTEMAEKFDLGSSWQFLSMGMSQDYQVAIEEGANLIRVGSAIFKSE